jgi:hypothetical protein
MTSPVAITALPGDYFVVATGGWEAKVIRFAERHNVNPADRVGAWANHAGIIGEDGVIWQANPGGGFQPGHIDQYAGHQLAWSSRPLTSLQRERALGAMEPLQGIPYSWLDILALGVSTLGAVPDPVWHRLDRPDRLICSQAVAHIYRQIGDPLTGGPDCRVTPAHLARPVVLTGKVVLA